METPIADNVIDIWAGRRAIPAPLLVKLRALNAEIAERQRLQQALIDGCVYGLGIDLDTFRVEFNLDAGAIVAIAIPREVWKDPDLEPAT